ncbi:AAA family ATPase [Trichococcus shcherbakoviae]|uniref:Adenylyltransferase/cytidyltransferase family protein n=1 Tax=Trichococcus shcherbakoviae subsp. psychrophilus TaxID=2585775 RepID=A0A5C5E9V2_9LACT|nr:AAA family ATPase [Trichococcus shcherbakoviae]TNV69005.1 adenylyltransferase/cytidyltransferase family protein [Trichococcus shcherbakoviae subsp. psychrophilus]
MGNLYKDKLSGSRIGIVFGAFAPCHIGHLEVILEAKKENDGCVVIVCGQEGDFGEPFGLDVYRRFRYMRELFADDNQIYVVMAAGQGIPQKETDWESWLQIINLKIADSLQHSDAQKIWYTGKTAQAEALENESTDEVHLVDTSHYPVTGLNIRNDALRYFNAIALPFRRAFTKKVLVLGAPSGGKTTLVKDLAKLYSCPYSFEYSRQYQEESNVNDFELDGMDYQRLVTGQFQLNRDTIADPASQGMAILDTDVMVTKVYARLGVEDVDYAITPEEYAIVEQSANAFIARQLWDLILVVPPTLKYVHDGYRNMEFSEDSFLTTIHEMMLEEIARSGNLDKVVMLDAKGIGEKDEFSYYARYKQAKEAIDELMGHK